ncbi:hypothetical protein [Janthinobacterium sp. P210005]|uniref:hypothetical protein n=1 Tax=Janthinobacterium sp. P210005 TaxID=3112938 RepID=UPI002E26B097|nr:hypothetical protein [Janthinobacterium sp. P210005]
MNSIVTAKALAEKRKFAEREWFYDFRELTHKIKDTEAKKVADSLSARYSKITKSWSKESNSEWLCRIYLSAKMVMTATLQINSIEYAEERNIRITSPYLTYYSLLALLRGIVYTLPEVMWDDGKLVEISHHKAINLAFDHIAAFNKILAQDLKTTTLTSKAYRELISYRSPTSGDSIIESIGNLKSIATLLAEVAQFNSEILESSIIKNAENSSFEFLHKYIDDLSSVTVEGIEFFDREDAYRLDYLRRKYPLAPNLLHIMTEGHTEDFFGAWLSKGRIEDTFNPDKNWNVIFDIP